MNLFITSRDRLLNNSKLLEQSYQQGKPYPHLAIDCLFAPEILDYFLKEFPLNLDRDGITWEITRNLKLKSLGVSGLSDFTRSFYFWLNCQDFVSAIASIVNLDNLVGDPLFCGAGLYEILPGGKLEITGDRIMHPTLPLIVQFNLILCLNRYWHSGWGGEIELKNFQNTKSKVRYTPQFNRTVILPLTGKSICRIATASHSACSAKFLSIYYWSLIPM